MLEKLIGIISEKLCVESQKITINSSINDDLEADSLDLVELIMAVEEEFDIAFKDEDLSNMKTVQDIFNYIEKNVEK